jgi:hypothetical protein
LGGNRKFVPTRWSITAVDDTLSKVSVEMLKNYPWINEFRVYESWSLDNRFLVLMIPAAWSYELVEAKNHLEPNWERYRNILLSRGT